MTFIKKYKNLKNKPLSIIFRDIIFITFPELSWYLNKIFWRNRMRKLREKREPFVLQADYGGLGDHLAFSGLPELLEKKWGVKFQLSLSSPFRNEEIKNIVWGNNPYVKFVDKPGMSLSCPRIDKYKNYNDAFADVFGADKETKNIKIYYAPKKVSIDENDILCDLTFGPAGEHNGYTDKIFIESVVNYLRKNFSEKRLVVLLPKAGYVDMSIVNAVKKSDLKYRLQPVENIHHLADLLFSYQTRILLYSGAASLAAALDLPAIVLCNKLANPYFQYSFNEYVGLVKNKNV